ncbi:P-loop containing nucleoside triphosphate hydrolase protein [Paraphysoderma sedebokerense]|nr:P-loop containing nucleoside triphosphate hydrolase protein [Paraphysoderma sedebokerense]
MSSDVITIIPPTSSTHFEKSLQTTSISADNSAESHEKNSKSADTSTDSKSTKRKPKDEHKSEAKKRKTGSKSSSNQGTSEYSVPTSKLTDLGGVDHIIEEILELVAMPLAHPEIYRHTGVSPPRGILLHGPPGCGKTLLANAIAGEVGVPFINISAPSIVSGMSGESEKKIREVFEEAKELAPCIMFIDEIDAITPKRETAQREMERRIVAQLLTCMDDVSFEKTNYKSVIIIGATNRPDSLDPALRRAGRFDREIGLGVPDEEARIKILRVLSSKLRLAGDFDFKALAKLTPGYVGADLSALTAAAGLYAVKRIFDTLKSSIDDADSMDIDDQTLPNNEKLPKSLPSLANYSHKTIARFLQKHPNPLTELELEPLFITNDDFQLALTKVQPSSKREGFATIPDVTWDDVGALSYVRDELRMAVVEPVKFPELFQKVGINSPSGVLLWGPPGCGKTLLAKAVANESCSNFISVKGPELLNKYVGESERAVRQVFSRARASAPCVIFFDEIDALCPRRDDSKSESSARMVNTLLAELDGLESRKSVSIIAATNRPDIIDPAMLRPGRLDKLLYVELPTPAERVEILKTLVKKSGTPLGDDVILDELARSERCDGFSGADIAALLREASVSALRSTLRYINSTSSSSSVPSLPSPVATLATPDLVVKSAHFMEALTKVVPSVSKKDKKGYEMLRKKLFSGGGGAALPIPLPETFQSRVGSTEADDGDNSKGEYPIENSS